MAAQLHLYGPPLAQVLILCLTLGHGDSLLLALCTSLSCRTPLPLKTFNYIWENATPEKSGMQEDRWQKSTLSLQGGGMPLSLFKAQLPSGPFGCTSPDPWLCLGPLLTRPLPHWRNLLQAPQLLSYTDTLISGLRTSSLLYGFLPPSSIFSLV